MSTPAPSRSQAATSVPFRDDSLALAGGGSVAARFYGARAAGPTPVVLHFHGGHFDGGDVDCGARVAELLAGVGALVVSIDYPLAPAHPFPAAVEIGHAALEAIAKRRVRLGGEKATLWLAGEEAGGNLAAAVALMARDRQQPVVAGQILLSPMLDACVGTASMRDVRAGSKGCRFAEGWHSYLSRPDDVMHPYATPGRAMRLAGLPATLLVTAADDPLRDETRAFAHRLASAGVPVEFAQIGLETGWPASYGEAPDAASDRCRAWTDELIPRLRRFLGIDAALDAPDAAQAAPPTASPASPAFPSSARSLR